MRKHICKRCDKEFYSYKKINNFCSFRCYWDNLKGHPAWNKGLKMSKEFRRKCSKSHKGQIPWDKGKKRPEMIGNKYAFGYKDELASNWKGNKVGYRGLHYWVSKKLGKAKKCEHCSKEWDKPKSIHWANKGHNYKRNLTDWISLCVKCHKSFDAGKITIYSY